MKFTSLVLVAFCLIGLNRMAVAGQGVGSTASGPNVECELPSGVVKFIPVLICKHSGGVVK